MDDVILSERYELTQQIGAGGHGAVYKALDRQTHQVVAIKMLPPVLRQKEGYFERFTREISALARLHHPNIAAVKDFNVASGFPYIVMDYINGETLDNVLRRDGPLPIEVVLQIGIDLASAVAALHRASIIHRDIKPANIIVDHTGHSTLIDFGIPLFFDFASVTRNMLGTRKYMSPEAFETDNVDTRSDIYSLGVVLYECLTGEVPSRTEHRAVLSVIRYREDVPSWLESVILRCLEREPAARFQSGAEVWAALLEGARTLDQLAPLVLDVNPGTAPPEVIADILSDISLLYRMLGGSGINFSLDGIFALEGDLV